MEKIATLGNMVLASDTAGGYSGAYGIMKGLAETMFARLSPEDRRHVDRVLDILIEQEAARKSA